MVSVATPSILLAGDESLSGLLKYIFEQEGFQTILADGLEEVEALAEARCPHLIALDDLPPRGAAAAMRERIYGSSAIGHIPVMMLLAETADAAELKARNMERTDYMLKPVAPGELIERLHGLLRPPKSIDTHVLTLGDIMMELHAHRVYRNKRSIHLGPIEYRLLQHLLKNPRKVFSREELLSAIWGPNIHVIARTVDVHVSHLRRALSDGGEPNYIRTVRGAGYSLDPDSVSRIRTTRHAAGRETPAKTMVTDDPETAGDRPPLTAPAVQLVPRHRFAGEYGNRSRSALPSIIAD
jgi:two-component system phosphate regulon response regulator PhoB